MIARLAEEKLKAEDEELEELLVTPANIKYLDLEQNFRKNIPIAK